MYQLDKTVVSLSQVFWCLRYFIISIVINFFSIFSAQASNLNLAQNGNIIIEAESVNPIGHWQEHSFIESSPAGKASRTTLLFDPPESSLSGAEKNQTLVYRFKTNEAATYRIALFMGRDRSKFSTRDPANSKGSWGDVGNNDVYVSVIEDDTDEVVQKPRRLFVGTRLDLNDRMGWGNTYDRGARAQHSLKANTIYRLEVAGRGDGVIIDRITIRSDSHLRNVFAQQPPKNDALPRLPTPSIDDVDLQQFPLMERWSRAGVIGGIPKSLIIRRTINPGDSIQDAINDVEKDGGGVLVLKNGTYLIKDAGIKMKSRVVVRGESREGVRIESRLDSVANPSERVTVLFHKTEYAGIENLTINYVAPGGSKPRHDSYGSSDDKGTKVHGISITGLNNWVKGVNVLNSGADPIYITGNHNRRFSS